MAGTVDIVAIISPKPGKADRVEELLAEQAKWVKENEPNTLRYHLQRETKGDAPKFIMLETYTDMASIKAHGGSAPFRAMNKKFKEEGLIGEPMKVLFTKSVAGYASKL